MSRYRGPRLKKNASEALLVLTSKRPRSGSGLKNQLWPRKKLQYCICLEEKRKLHFRNGMTSDNYLDMYILPEKLKGQQVKSYYRYLRCVRITPFFDWI